MEGKPHLPVHDRRDNVGVVVVEDLVTATSLLCVVAAEAELWLRQTLATLTSFTAAEFLHGTH